MAVKRFSEMSVHNYKATWYHNREVDNCNKYSCVQLYRHWGSVETVTAHRGSTGIALPFHDHGTRRGWCVSVTPRPLFTPGKDPVPIVQESVWTPGPVWRGEENLAPTAIRSPDRPARSHSLYRLRYPEVQMWKTKITQSTRNLNRQKWLLRMHCMGLFSWWTSEVEMGYNLISCFQPNALVYYIFSYSSTCFEPNCAHHQEDLLYIHSIWFFMCHSVNN